MLPIASMMSLEMNLFHKIFFHKKYIKTFHHHPKRPAAVETEHPKIADKANNPR